MTEKRLGVGLVGSGFVAQFHIQSWQGVRDADITAISSPTREHAEAAGKLSHDLGVGTPKIYTEIAQMVRDPNVDAIWITAPNYARVPVVEAIVNEINSGRAELIGVTCEKPLARNVAEAQQMLDLIDQTGILHGYLENQVFTRSLSRGKELVWKRGVPIAGRPYLARAAEEHSGPHMPWFWQGSKQGGGVLTI